MPKNIIAAIPVDLFDSATLTANLQPMLTNPFAHPLIRLRIYNNSNVDVIISYNGIDDQEYIVSGELFELNAQMLAQPRNQMCQIPAGSTLYIKQATAPGIGDIIVSGYYNPE
jgi:hypothetical protein